MAGAPDLVLIVRLRPWRWRAGRSSAASPASPRGSRSTCWPSTRSDATRSIYCVAGYCLGAAGEKLRPPAPVRSLLLVALATALVRIAEGGIAFMLGSDGALGRAFGVQLAAAPAASVLFAIPLLALLRFALGVKAPPRRQFPLPEPLPEPDVAATA